MNEESNATIAELIERNETVLDAIGFYEKADEGMLEQAEVYASKIADILNEGFATNGVTLLVGWAIYRHQLAAITQLKGEE